MTTTGTFYGLGVGPGDPNLLTLRAAEVIRSVDIVFEAIGKNSKDSVSGRVVDSVKDSTAERRQLVFSMSLDTEIRSEAHRIGAQEVAEALKQGKNCAFVTIGDPLIYSTYVYLLREILKIIPDLKVETVPGITSYQAAAAKNTFTIVEDTEKLCVVPAFSEELFEDCNIARDADTLVMLKTYKTRDDIPAFLKKNGYAQHGLYASKVGAEDELFETDLQALSELPQEYLSLIIAKKNN